MDRDEALALLRSQHPFPGPFDFRVVILPAARSGVLSAMSAAAGPEAALLAVDERASSQGTYLSLRVRMSLPDAENVLHVYEILRDLEGVKTAL
ncbi:MAG: DUF493 domain-containing protein [Deltaproteobacteria bacterium]|nr:DUF493 domain-containing protein [Deltaproteobacteria bacterium]